MHSGIVNIKIDSSFWDRFFLPFPLVIVGSKEGDKYDLAPKHMAIPLSWDNHYGFVCTEQHATYHNIKKHGFFTVSYPKVDQLALASLTACQRSDKDKNKMILNHIENIPAVKIDGVFLKDSFLMLECELFKIIDGFGINSLITGKIIHARIDEEYLREVDRNEQLQIYNHPVLSYIHPGRYAAIKDTAVFPFPKDFKK
jgi:flavin reductase (DIM6/NTAB) family NADH-FMN oxidoreductase RutF